MSIGSAFDAYVKSHIYGLLFGKAKLVGSPYEFVTIFEKQVENHNRIWAREHGKVVFDRYIASGALADLMLMLNKAIGEPRFEFDLKGEVRDIDKTIDGVVFMGKPDIYWTNSESVGIMFDWKVNGYLSNHTVSPKPGYVCIKPGFEMHRDCVRAVFKGVTINKKLTLDRIDKEWAAQLSIYSWLCGEEVGSKFITAIDQIVCNTKGGSLKYPELRFAQHRLCVDEDFQKNVFALAKDLWSSIHSGHYFPEMSREDSDAMCRLLDERAAALWKPLESEEDKAFAALTNVRRPWRG